MRLTEIKRRGKAISLKYMVRALDAPVETAKYMGHGVCDNITKTVTLQDYTDDRSTIERTVFVIKNALNVPPSELRGIGIQITKLDGGDDSGAVVTRPINNALKMMFDKVAEKNKDKMSIAEPISKHSKVVNQSEPTARSSRGRKCSAVVGRPRKLTETANQSMENNHSEELDMDVLAKLPDDIRAEVLREYNIKPALLKAPEKPIIQLKQPSNIVDEDFLAALPSDIRAEVLRDQNIQRKELHEKFIDSQRNEHSVEEPTASNLMHSTKASSSTTKEDIRTTAIPTVADDNIFIQANWRQTLQQWLDTTNDPNDPPVQSDVNTVLDCAVELVRSRQINTIYLGMRFLHRFVYVCKLITSTY